MKSFFLKGQIVDILGSKAMFLLEHSAVLFCIKSTHRKCVNQQRGHVSEKLCVQKRAAGSLRFASPPLSALYSRAGWVSPF